MDFEKILSGYRPSDIFKKYLTENPGSSGGEMGMDFFAAFPEVDRSFQSVIWNWKGAIKKRRPGISDEVFDKETIICLKEAGYFVLKDK
ncbi:hypothetical protein [Sphingomonas colocasiae]|uniref:Uncharacterized protein n=1 Tax=Sphingomonas colocasiae TaxID=1848973 RepID=A0ABS7PKW3_9SPHN|nr:hypothetical protein [Sphingomonas colocasiae]MBY8821930.1 hypothetical protein [Sphingomonas colocasiae]